MCVYIFIYVFLYKLYFVCFTGASRNKWLPLSLDTPPSRQPLSKGMHRDRHRDYDKPHGGGRGNDRGYRMGGESGVGFRDIGSYRDGGNKDGHSHRGDKDGYKGHYYKYGGGGHDRDRERAEGRDHRKGERFSNLPPRYSSSQTHEYGGLEGSGSYMGGGGGFDGNGHGYGGGRGRAGRGRNWRYMSSGQGLLCYLIVIVCCLSALSKVNVLRYSFLVCLACLGGQSSNYVYQQQQQQHTQPQTQQQQQQQQQQALQYYNQMTGVYYQQSYSTAPAVFYNNPILPVDETTLLDYIRKQM